MTIGRPFQLHLGHGEVLPGLHLPGGPLVVVDDPEFGLASQADTVEDLLAGYGHGHITWLDGGDENGPTP
ncbi:hypothetical protein [Streptomyces sp. NPDC102487]|uniref:hypothetical protein n=1 Tax=Streptomyces sp. NPDC102487 TaxID=3366182 RepID=UPI003801F2D1